MDISFELVATPEFEKSFGKIEAGITKMLGRVGGYCRKVMRHSIKSGQEGDHSDVDGPALSRLGYLKDWIRYAVDREELYVVIGPMKLNKPGWAPKALEYGGESLVMGWNGELELVYVRRRPTARLALLETKERMAELLANSMTGFSFETSN